MGNRSSRALTPLPVILWGFLLNTFAFEFDIINHIVTRRISKKKQALQELSTQKTAVTSSTKENVSAVTCV